MAPGLRATTSPFNDTYALDADVEIKWAGEVAKRIAKTGHGTNMGDWKSILQDCTGKGIPTDFCVSELREFLKSSQTLSAAKALADMRNDQSHGRGPKGPAVGVWFKKGLEQLPTRCRWLSFSRREPTPDIARSPTGARWTTRARRPAIAARSRRRAAPW